MTAEEKERPGPNSWLMAALVFALTFLAYFPTLHGAVLWDDNGHVTKAELRSIEGLWRIWFDLGASQQYYPILHTAFWVEHRLWGDATLGYHLVNILLHAANACLFALVLRRLSLRRAAAWTGALLFALHPVCVESVAWISEQKNTLSTFFYLLAALAYLGFYPRWESWLERKGGAGLGAISGRYVLASALFVLALLSKTVTATLPAALLVVIGWSKVGAARKSDRRSIWGWIVRDFLPLLPWLAFGALMGMFTAWVERNVIGAEGGSFELSVVQRCILAGRVIWFYLGKLVLPVDLIFVYPHWTIDSSAWPQYLFSIGVLALLAFLVALAWRGKSSAASAPLASFLFFCGTLFPVLGFFNIYPFRFSYVADHFQYLASLGIIALAAAGWQRLAARLPAPGKGVPASAGALIPAAVIAILGLLSWRESHMYLNDETLYRTTLARNPGCWMAENNLGTYLSKLPGGGPEAISHFLKAIRLNPTYAEGHNNLGSEYSKIPGRLPEALAEIEEAVRLNPQYADARNNLGLVLAQSGRMDEAEAEFKEAIRLKPDFSEAHTDYGVALGKTGRLDEAIVELREAVRLKPESVEARKNLAYALARTGRLREAIDEYEEAGRMDPADPELQRILAAIREHMPSLDRQ